MGWSGLTESPDHSDTDVPAVAPPAAVDLHGLPFEIGLKLVKRVGDMRLKSVQHWYSGRSIFESYATGDLECHIHAKAASFCVTVRFAIRMEPN